MTHAARTEHIWWSSRSQRPIHPIKSFTVNVTGSFTGKPYMHLRLALYL